jgi:hypothetical protein
MFNPTRKVPVMHVGPDLNRCLNATMSYVAYTLEPMRTFLGNGSNSYAVSGAKAYSTLGGYEGTAQINISGLNLNMI